MSLKDKISAEIILAMKAKQKTRLNVLRYLKKLFIENDSSTKKIDEQDIVISYAKKTKDSLSLYPEGSDQAKEIIAEVAVLQEFLPTQLTEVDVQGFIDEIKASLDNPNMGMIMKELSSKIKGKFDGKKASDMVKSSI